MRLDCTLVARKKAAYFEPKAALALPERCSLFRETRPIIQAVISSISALPRDASFVNHEVEDLVF